jgi:DNA-binding transcriptional regulator YiaG
VNLVLKPHQINVLRKRRGLTYGDLAKVCRVSPVAVHFWISGRNFPNAEHNEKLKRVLI